MVFNGDESLMHDSVVRWGNIIEDIIRSHHCYSMVMRNVRFGLLDGKIS